MRARRIAKIVVLFIISLFIGINVIAFIHAYKFTHFSHEGVTKTKDPKALSAIEKLKTALFGINNPRPINKFKPTQAFETIYIQSNVKLECWYVKADSSSGTILLFHGYSGDKSTMLNKADEFLRMRYDVLLVDFMGSGGSEGDVTTIGYKEAENVKSCYDYIAAKGKGPIYLFGTSMGAAAVLKSISDYHFQPTGIMIECPFGSMYKTTCARFKTMHIPSFPMAGILVFWGGVQNGFWAFGHQPTEYAKTVTCPTMLLYGEKDEKVSREEIDEIYANLNGHKTLRTYPLAAHEDYLRKYKNEWVSNVADFLRNQ